MKRIICAYCNKEFIAKSPPSKPRKFCSVYCKSRGQIWNLEGLKKGHGWNKGTKGIMKSNNTSFKKGTHYSPSTEWKKGDVRISGSNQHSWKGGVTPVHKAIRRSFEYEEWRKQVFERDNYTCQGCGKIGGWLEADHIKPFSLFPELRLEISNGRTLCKPCHKKLGWELFREANPRRSING